MAGATEAQLVSIKSTDENKSHVADNMIFEFLEESELSSESSFSSRDSNDNGDFEEDENSCDPEENKLFWESQEELLTVNN